MGGGALSLSLTHMRAHRSLDSVKVKCSTNSSAALIEQSRSCVFLLEKQKVIGAAFESPNGLLQSSSP